MRGKFALLPPPDVLIRGAGVIGLSLALELRRRGASVAVLDPRGAASQASWAAAGMLAVEDPHNPPELKPLALLSNQLYPSFLQAIEALSGQPVPFQTDSTLQTTPDGLTRRLAEHSLDPRQLALALLEAVQRTGVEVRQHLTAEPESSLPPSTVIVHTSGAWTCMPTVFPRKGQMLRVILPHGCSLHEVHRNQEVYLVPRTQGSQAGTALIGASVEDAGFNTEIAPGMLAHLRSLAAQLVPAVLDPLRAPMVEAWAGLRPATPDGLPLLGPTCDAQAIHGSREFIATGHFRNGILLAPATAVVLADLIENRTPVVDLTPFSAERFVLAGT